MDTLIGYFTLMLGTENSIETTMNPRLTPDQQRALCSQLGGGVSLKLLYKASVHGFTAAEFHERCDNQKPTVSVGYNTSGYVFGGYTTVAWEDDGHYGEYRNDDKAFLFTFKGANVIRYQVTQPARAVYMDSSCGPCFGHCSLILVDNNQAVASSIPSGHGYEFPAAEMHGDDLKLTECEVYTVEAQPKAVTPSVPAKPKAVTPSVPDTSLLLDTQRITKEMEDSKRRQHQLDQDHQELRAQYPVLDSQVKRLAAQFEESRSQRKEELEKIHQRQTEADKKQTRLSLTVMETSRTQQRVNQDVQEQLQKLTVQMEELQFKSASATLQHPTHGEAAKKLRSVREQFIQRISEATLKSLLDKLLDKDVISDDEMEAAKGEMLRADKARYVIDTVRRKGDQASSQMIDIIDQLDRNLGDFLKR